MKARGSIPRVAIEADIILPLEAPADEPTLPGGFHGGIPIRAPKRDLDAALSTWDRETWGGEA